MQDCLLGLRLHQAHPGIPVLGVGLVVQVSRAHAQVHLRAHLTLSGRPAERAFDPLSSRTTLPGMKYVALVRPAACAASTSSARRYGLPLRVLPLRRLPALSLFPGAMPAHAARCA